MTGWGTGVYDLSPVCDILQQGQDSMTQAMLTGRQRARTRTRGERMKRYKLERDGDVDVTFEGDLVASVDSRKYGTVKPDADRWSEIRLYKTASGKIVAHEIGNTKMPGERVFRQVYICDSKSELVEELGGNWLAKKLYDSVGIEASEEI